MEGNNRKKLANRCHGTSKCSTRKCQTCKHKTDSKTKISKYFTKPATDLGNSVETEAGPSVAVKSNYDDSPYKHSLTELNCKVNDSICDEKDFMSPIVIRKKRTATKEPAPKPTKSKPQQRTRQTKKRACTFQKTIEDSFKNLDVNPDHLQMALALSESTHHAENPESQEQKSEDMFEFMSKSATLKSNLERFGFRYRGVQSRTSTSSYHEAPKKKKKSKFAFVTPILLMRTEEDREATITSKVSLILSEVCRDQNVSRPKECIHIGSEMLQKYNSQKRRIFNINCMELSDLNDGDLFYTASLTLSTERSRCGCLLKNWQDIPGRESSPPRLYKTSLVEEDTTVVCIDSGPSSDTASVQPEKEVEKSCNQQSDDVITVETYVRRSISPDLFCDDEDDVMESPESDESKKLPSLGNRNSSSKSTLEEFEDNNGIYHFESFHEDEIKLSQGKIKHLSQSQDIKGIRKDTKQCDPSEVCDLTISSDEEMNDVAKTQTESKGNRSEFNIQDRLFQEKEPNTKLSHSQIKQCAKDIVVKVTNEKENVEEDKLVSNKCEESSIPINTVLISDSEIDHPEDVPNDDVMNEDTIILENTFSNVESPGQCSNENAQKSDPTSNRFSVGFDFNFSNESSLNITRYINSMLNKSLEVSKECSLKEASTVEAEVGNDLKGSKVNRNSNEQGNSSPKHIDQESDDFAACLTQCSSQEVQHISDEELDYSSNFKLLSKRKSKVNKKLEYQDDDPAKNLTAEHVKNIIVLSDDSSDSGHNKKDKIETKDLGDDFHNDSIDDVLGNLNTTLIANHISHIAGSGNTAKTTPNKSTYNQDTNLATPKNTVIIKTDNVTPMPCYDNMDTPKLLKELDKFGLKPLKRQRGVQLLKYIYESTHPIVGPQEEDSSEEESEHRKSKKRKEATDESKKHDDNKISSVTSENTKSIDNVEIVGDILSPRESECNLIFERRQSSKVASCRIPLDIVWHNFISSNTEVRENMLLYEPLQLEVLHSMLKDIGFKFHIQDLLTFLDRKCITVRVASSQGRAKRK